MSNCMFQHLIGQYHRQKVVDNFYNDDPQWLDMTQSQLLKFATEHNENDDRVYDKIETRYSDDVSNFVSLNINYKSQLIFFQF